MDELKTERLLDLAEGRLAADEAAELRRSVAERGHGTELAWIESFVRRSSAVVIGDAPADLRQRLVTEYTTWAAEHRRPTLVERIVGTLSFGGSTMGPALAGLRGTAAPAARQLLLSGGSIEIAFQVDERDGAIRIDGQVLPLDDTPVDGAVELRVAGIVAASALVDEVGEFTLDDLDAGPCELVYVFASRELTSGPFDLGPPASGPG